MGTDWAADLQNIFQKGEGKSLILPTQSLLWHEYQELVTLPGVMDVQLQMAGASKDDVAKFPARTSRQDSTRYFPWIKAANNFRVFSSKPGSQQSQGGELCILTINFECSQETLDTLVKAIYQRKIDLTTGNVKDILKLADFLQAEWLTTLVLSHVKNEALEGSPLSVFKIGQHFHNADMANSAIARVAKRSRKDMEELLDHNVEDDLQEERNILISLSEGKSLESIVDAMLKSSSSEGCKLTERRRTLLTEKFPAHKDILQCLISAETPDKALKLYDSRRLQLAAKLLSVREVTAQEENADKHKFQLLVSEFYRRGRSLYQVVLRIRDGRSFQMQVAPFGGEWGFTLRPMYGDKWRNGDHVTIRSLIERSFVHKVNIETQNREIIGSSNDLQMPGVLATWARSLSACSCDKDTICLRLEFLAAPK